MKRALVCSQLLCCAVAGQVLADGVGPGPFTIRRLGSNGGSTPEQGRAINDAGVVVGVAPFNNGSVAIRDINGTSANLGWLGGTSSSAEGISQAGDIVGYSNNGSGVFRAFIYRQGVMTDLGSLPGSASRDHQAFAVNDHGLVVGVGRTTDGSLHPVAFTASGVVDLGTLGGANGTATDVNNQGQIVGNALASSQRTHAFLYQSGGMIDLGTLPGETPRLPRA